MNTGEKIHKIRTQKNISQYELANIIKTLNQSQISKIESGVRRVTDKDLVAIANALEVSITELLNIDEVS